MSEQDIGIRISANTSEAEQSIQDLESTINGMQDLQAKGVGQGFLNDDDIQHFQTLSDQATQIYQDFYQNIEQMISQLEDKRSQLQQQMSQSIDQTQIDDLKRKIADIDVQQVSYSSQRTIADNLNTNMGSMNQSARPYMNGTYTQQSPSPSYSGGNNGNGNVGGNGGGTMPSGGGFLGNIGNLLGTFTGTSQIMSGLRQINDQEATMAQVGTRVGGFGNRFDLGRWQAGQVGYPNGYTSAQTIELANQYSSLAGASSPSALWSRVGNIQQQSRELGLNPNQLAQTEGQIAQTGALGSTADQQQFADMIAGAVKQDNMQGRQGELVSATGSLVSQAANGQTTFTNGQVQNILGLQAVVGQNNPMLRGAGGAQMLGNINSAIQAGGPQMGLLLGYGTKYQGISGQYQVMMHEAQGISNPQNLKDIFNNISKYGGSGSQGEQAREIALSRSLGISLPQAHALYGDPNIRKQIESGQMSQKEIQNLLNQGGQINDQNGQNYDSSQAGQRAQNAAGWSQVQQQAASPFDQIMQGIGSFFTPQNAMFGGIGLLGMMGLSGGGLGGFLRNIGKGAKSDIGGIGNAARNVRDRWNQSAAGKSMNEDVRGLWSRVSGTKAWDTVSNSRFGQAAGDVVKNFRTYMNPRNLMDQAGRTLNNVGRAGADVLDNAGKYFNPRNLTNQWDRTMQSAGKYLNPEDLGREGASVLDRAGGLLKGAGRFLGPIGDIAGIQWATQNGSDFGDWLFGHRKGQQVTPNILSNPFSMSRKTYTDNRESALQKGWDWFTGLFGGNKNNSSSSSSSSTNLLGLKFNPKNFKVNKEFDLSETQKKAIDSNPIGTDGLLIGTKHVGLEQGLQNAWSGIRGLFTNKLPEGALNANLTGTGQDRKEDLNRREINLEQSQREDLNKREQLDNNSEKNLQSKKDNQSKNNNQNSQQNRMSAGSGGDNWLTQMFHGIGSFFQNMFGGIGNLFGGGSSTDKMTNGVSKGASSWSSEIEKAAKAEGINLNSSELRTIEQRISKESNGNETAINLTDSNAKAGHPSQGLLQYIQSTFNKYAVSGHTNINSGYDQLLALFNDKNWLKDISVSGGWGPSGSTRGYAAGTNYSMGGNVTVSENGEPEMIRDPYGRTVLSTQQTSFSDFMAGSTVTPINTSTLNGSNINQSAMLAAMTQIARLSSAGSTAGGSRTVNIKISGGISGLTKENNDSVASAIAGYFSGGQPMAYDFSRS